MTFELCARIEQGTCQSWQACQTLRAQQFPKRINEFACATEQLNGSAVNGWALNYRRVGSALLWRWRNYSVAESILRGRADLQGPAARIFPSDVPPFDAAEDVEHENDDHPARNGSFPAS